MKHIDFNPTKQEIDFYRDNGYLVIEDVFSSEDCDSAVSIYEKYAKPDFRGIMNLERGVIEYHEIRDGTEEIEEISVADSDAETIWNVIRYPVIAETLYALQEDEVMYLQSMFLFKKVRSRYAKQAWWPHQDNAYPQAPKSMYITGNICFSDQSPENGGMYIFPGSHREPLLPFESMKSFHEKEGENPGHKVAVPPQYRKVDLYMKQGSVLFLHGHVIHGSYPNNSPVHSRPMLLIPYGSKGISSQQNFLKGRVGRREEHSLHDDWRTAFGKKKKEIA